MLPDSHNALSGSSGPRCPSQTWPPRPCSTRGGSLRFQPPADSSRGVPAGPKTSSSARSTPLTSSSWAKPFAKDVAIAVPLPPVHLPPSVVSDPRAVARLPSARIFPGSNQPVATTPRLCRMETPGMEKRRQLAVGSAADRKQGKAQRTERHERRVGSGRYALCAWRQAVWKRQWQRREGQAPAALAEGRGDRESGRSGERAAGSFAAGSGAAERVDLPVVDGH